MTFVSVSAPAGWTCSTPAPGAGGTVTCSNPSLAITGGEVFTLIGHVPPGTPAGTIYTNTASVSTSTFDPNGNNNSSSAMTSVTEPNADMGVSKLASASQVPPDSDITYTITVTNGGPSAAVDATMSDTLPGNMTFVSIAAPAGWTCSSPCTGLRRHRLLFEPEPGAHRWRGFYPGWPRSPWDARGDDLQQHGVGQHGLV